MLQKIVKKLFILALGLLDLLQGIQFLSLAFLLFQLMKDLNLRNFLIF